MKKRNVLIVFIILAVAVVSLGAGFVIAETTIDEKIFAAYSLKTGTMRYLTDPTSYNPKLEAPISWNVQGVPGAGFNTLEYANNDNYGFLKATNCFDQSGNWVFTPVLLDEQNDPSMPPTAGCNPSPSTTVEITSGKALVIITSGIDGMNCWVSFNVSGSTTRDGSFHQALGARASHTQTCSATFVATGLNNGTNTFTLVYNAGCDPVHPEWIDEYCSGYFYDRSIIVIPLP